MDYRTISIFNGMQFDVPKHIVRIDIVGPKNTHGWQVRYGKPWKFFSDNSLNGTGAEIALTNATNELIERIATLPAPSYIRQQIANTKSSGLPSGISGPFKRQRKGRNVADYSFQVSLPVHRGRSKTAQIYIATESTITEERVQLAISKSVDLRKKFITKFQNSVTETKRGKALKA